MSKNIIFGTGLSSYKDYNGLKTVCKVAMENGISRFDTAPSYQTEALLSNVIKECANELGMSRANYSIQTKIDPIQMYNLAVEVYFMEKLKEMKLEYIDSLLIHWPLEKYMHQTWEALKHLQKDGITKKIGICNLRIRHLKKLNEQGIYPEILQIERHPLNTFEEETAWCRKNGVILQDYSPLCKMHPRIKENMALNNIARKHNKDIGQIVLRWHIDTGATPIFTSKNPTRIKRYSSIFDFSLTKEEINIISSANCNHKLYLESLVCPGF